LGTTILMAPKAGMVVRVTAERVRAAQTVAA
jgi:hypothetical protein